MKRGKRDILEDENHKILIISSACTGSTESIWDSKNGSSLFHTVRTGAVLLSFCFYPSSIPHITGSLLQPPPFGEEEGGLAVKMRICTCYHNIAAAS